MTKQDVIRQIVARTGSDPLTSRLVLESFFEVVKSTLSEGDPIYVRTFGSFILKQRAAKVGRNISRNTTVSIAAHALPCFKPSQEFRDQVRAQPVPTPTKAKRAKK